MYGRNGRGDLMGMGFVKVNRNFLYSDLIREPVTFTVFMYLLLRAGYRNRCFRGQEIRIGETVATYPSIALGTGITERQARTALAKLVKSGMVSVRRYPKFSVVTVIDYDEFQGVSGSGSVKSQPDDSQPVTEMSPFKEINNKKEIKNGCRMNEEDDDGGEDEEEQFRRYGWGHGGTVLLSECQVEKLLKELSLAEFNFYIERLDRFMKEKNVAVRNPCETILKWAEQDRMV